MTDDHLTDSDYDLLVQDDLAHTPQDRPDVAALVDAGGRRLRRRRQGWAAGAVVGVAAAVAVPAILVGGADADGERPVRDPRLDRSEQLPLAGTDDGPEDSPAPDPAVLKGCGWFSCAEGRFRADETPTLGDVWTVNSTGSGLDEVVYAVDTEVFDVTTDAMTQGTALFTGFARDGEHTSSVFALTPGHELVPDCSMMFYSAITADDGWAMLGYAEGEGAAVSYEGGSGDGSVETNDAVLPGYTVFVAHGPGHADGDYPTSFTADGVTETTAGCAGTG